RRWRRPCSAGRRHSVRQQRRRPPGPGTAPARGRPSTRGAAAPCRSSSSSSSRNSFSVFGPPRSGASSSGTPGPRGGRTRCVANPVRRSSSASPPVPRVTALPTKLRHVRVPTTAVASAPQGALARPSRLLAVVGSDHVLDLLLHRVQVERRRVLHRRGGDGRLCPLCHPLLGEDGPPEIAGGESVCVAGRPGQPGPPRRYWGDARGGLA